MIIYRPAYSNIGWLVVLSIYIYIMKDKTQRVSSYVSAYGITIYEVEQYNKACDAWFIVGDCSESREWIEWQVNDNNSRL